MKSGSTPQFRVALAVLASLLFAVPAMATTFLMATDQSMVEKSSAVVEARVLSRDHAPGIKMPSTDYMIEVTEVLSGEVTGRNLIVRVPGGERPDGIGLRLSGMPEFVIGERVLLFLNPRADGTYGIRHQMLGAFHEVARAGQSVYVRSLQGAQEMVVPGLEDKSGFYRLRAAEPFRRWVEGVGRGDSPRPDYFIEREAGLGEDGDPGRVTGQFTLFRDTQGRGANNLNIRWFNFDSGGSVDWRNGVGGQPGFNSNATANAFRSGMASWNNDNRSLVNYRYVGTTGSSSGLSDLDGVNSLVYRNVDESISDGDFECDGNSASGVLALGGPFYCRPGSTIREAPHYPNIACPAGSNAGVNAAFEADIVTNRGIECLFQILRGLDNGAQRAQRALEALFGHELGHTLGIGHSCTGDDDPNCNAVRADALMYPFLHTDGRGSVLNSDDRAAVRFLYPGSAAPQVPAAPTNLIAELIDATSIELTWQDNSNDESSFVIETSISGAGFETLTSVAANTETLELSDLEDETTFRFRVRARNSQGSSVPSNEVELATEVGLPDAPAGLVAQTGSATSALLTWQDRSDNETEFVVEALTADSDGEWFPVQSGITADPDASNVETEVDGLETGLPHTFRVRALNSAGLSGPSNVDAATPDEAVDGCVEGPNTLCLLNDRFRVRSVWRNFRVDPGVTGMGGVGDDLGDRTGTFWFFNPDNVELIVKVLDGTNINEFYWTFYGSLSDVEYWITVVDTESGDSRTYYNAPEQQCGRLDNASIPVDLPTDPGASSRVAAVPLVISGEAEAGTCVASDTTLCLLDDRFAVEVDWVVPSGDPAVEDEAGQGTALTAEGSERTGYFWFFKEDNIELVVKALDGRGVNGYFWFFYGALSNVEYEITVTDTVDGKTRTYRNEFGNECGQFDNIAFLPEGSG